MLINDIISKVERSAQAARRERPQSPDMIQKTKAVRFPKTTISDLYLFEVQSAAAADGIYVCYKQTTWGVFAPPEIEVLNLVENDTITDYTPALALGDKIAASQMKDSEGTLRWAGFPLVPSVRMIRTTEDAGNNQQLTCNMVPDGEVELSSPDLGSNIEVYWKVCGGLVAADKYLSNASPRFSDNDYSFAVNISGKWHCVGVAQAEENRVCE